MMDLASIEIEGGHGELALFEPELDDFGVCGENDLGSTVERQTVDRWVVECHLRLTGVADQALLLASLALLLKLLLARRCGC
jgi:SAM-dependent MidA family methyltransferase